MIATPKIRSWKALALLTALIAVLLLLLPHASDHHAVALFLLVPLFLFIEPVEALIPYQPNSNQVLPPKPHVRSTLFQRPPPPQA